MNKYTIGAGVVAVIAIIAFVALREEPEPTPGEKLDSALQEIGTAVDDAAKDVEEAKEEASEALSESVEEMNAKLAKLQSDIEDSEVFTEEGFDFDKAVEIVRASDLEPETQDELIDILEEIRDAPENFDAKMAEFSAALSGAEAN